MLQLDWNATVDAIRETLPQTQFQNWIKPVSFLRATDRAVVLGVPSRFHEEWLRSHYSQQLRLAIHKQCGTELQLEFEVLAEGSPRPVPLAPVAAAAPAPAPAIVPRPALRIVDNAEKAMPPAPPPPAQPPQPDAVEAPQLPIFQHPFSELNFNMVAYQCAGLFTQGNIAAINPLIIQGGVGMGKTHLLAEIGRWMHRTNPRSRIRYTNAEAFTNEMVQHLQSNNILSFKRRYGAETDCLLFDDVQALAGRAKTQETLLHIFNEITNRGGRIAFTMNCAPSRLGDFIDPLRSRLHSGVIAEIRPATHEERVEMLGRMCEHHRLSMDPTALRVLADKGQSDIRELIGSLLRLHLQAKIQNRRVDTEYVSRQSMAVAAPGRTASMDEIIALVEHNFAVPRVDLVSKSRKGQVTWARQVAMYLARTYTLLPLEEIGKAFGRDHATVIHAFTKVTDTMTAFPQKRYEVEFLKGKMQARTPQSETRQAAPSNDVQPSLFGDE